MKSELQEIMEQVEEAIDPMMAMAQVLYKKMGENLQLWQDLAKCYSTAVEAFIAEGFSRDEAIAAVSAALGNLGKK